VREKNKQKDMSYVRRLRLRRCADALPSLELFLVAFEAGVGSDKWVPGAYAQGGESVCWQGGCARNKLSWMESDGCKFVMIRGHGGPYSLRETARLFTVAIARLPA